MTHNGSLAGAKVTLSGLDQTILAITETRADGIFQASLPLQVKDFIVEVSGGHVLAKPNTDVLFTEIRNRPAIGHYAPVNAITTLSSAYRKSNPALSIDKANSEVKTFLSICSVF